MLMTRNLSWPKIQDVKDANAVRGKRIATWLGVKNV